MERSSVRFTSADAAAPWPRSKVLREASGIFSHMIQALQCAASPSVGDVVSQIESVGVGSVGVACIIGATLGAVTATQFVEVFERFGARSYAYHVVGIAITRELVPLVIGLTVGCRGGAGIAAELGAMAVTEQIDAMIALGSDPIQKLVLPRVVACGVALPVLTAIADLSGLVSAFLISERRSAVPAGFFVSATVHGIAARDLVIGFSKGPLMGVLIALIGSYYGMIARDGAAEVGRNVARAVMVTSGVVLAVDVMLSGILTSLLPR